MILSTKLISLNLLTRIYVSQDERQSQFLYGRIQKTNSNEENSDFENETGTDMIDVLEDDEIVIDDD